MTIWEITYNPRCGNGTWCAGKRVKYKFPRVTWTYRNSWFIDWMGKSLEIKKVFNGYKETKKKTS